jgi:tRNA 2-thiocytidine biosynthesis protein TtcA
MRELLNQWEKGNPLWVRSMMTAMQNVVPSHMLDRTLFDFDKFTVSPQTPSQGDILFDNEEQEPTQQNVVKFL